MRKFGSGALVAGVLALVMPAVAAAQEAASPPPPVIVTVQTPPPAKGPADPASTTPEDVKQYGSLYVRCDGQPNNMSDAELFGRLVSLSLVVGLLAPSPETADPAKRLFADRGVAACSKLIDGEDKREGNGLRRIPLILARATHRIEAKDYDGAIADVGLARGEAQALGLVGNPYFDRSMGLSYDILESEALLRAGKPAEAREVGLRSAARMPYSYYATIASRTFGAANRDLSAGEEAYFRSASKIMPYMIIELANRLDEAGRFSEAAACRESQIVLNDALNSEKRQSWSLASAAVSHALAGEWEQANARASEARSNMDALAAAGTPEESRSSVVEVLDLYTVLKLAHDGKLDDARRNFAARSQWTAPSFGSVMAANTLLRQGARPEQLFGALEPAATQMWEKRKAEYLAARLENDKNNKTLFAYILPYAKIGSFESQSKTVWKADKSKLLAAKQVTNSKFWVISLYAEPLVRTDALLLHSALVAKARGFKGFVFLTLPKFPSAALVQFGNADDADIARDLYLDADAVIAELRQVIPSPEELAERRKQKK